MLRVETFETFETRCETVRPRDHVDHVVFYSDVCVCVCVFFFKDVKDIGI